MPILYQHLHLLAFKMQRGRIKVLDLILLLAVLAKPCLAVAPEELRVAPGLVCTIAADDSFVHDAFTMTLDAQGRPVVSGPGYIRTLIDNNNDGKYDDQVTWLAVQQGAQGLWREGNQLYYVADKGLWRSTDTNGDLKGDGRPEMLLQLPTGGEHDAHAIRRGPDGFWYLTCGNFSSAQVQQVVNDTQSPVPQAKAGLILRISPDFKTRSVWAHGLRNTYDFDFLPNGEVVTFDSDEEREMSLPTYRPTRVVVMSPGSDGGWVTPAWIDDDVRLTMPLNLASIGRASPTGVCVYQATELGERFVNSVIALDWTFGRVIAVYPELTPARSGEVRNLLHDRGQCRWETLLEPGGTAGFAPTDVCVAANGDLLVCTGGRGTAGTLFRLSGAGANNSTAKQSDPTKELFVAQESSEATAVDVENADTAQKRLDPVFTSVTKDGATTPLEAQQSRDLSRILTQICPWESWAMERWKPLITDAVSMDLVRVLSGEIQIELPENCHCDVGDLRLKAAQILVHTGVLTKGEALASAIASQDDSTRAAGWYVMGRGKVDADAAIVQQIFNSSLTQPVPNLSAAASAWSDVLGCYSERARWEAFGLRNWLCKPTVHQVPMDIQSARSLQQLEAWAYHRQSSSDAEKSASFAMDLAKAIYEKADSAYRQSKSVDAGAFDRLAKAIQGGQHKTDAVEILSALCLVQTALTDPRTAIANNRNPENASIFDGYNSQRYALIDSRLRTGWATYCLNVADTADERDWAPIADEAIRTIAFFRPDADSVLNRLLDRITNASHPTRDINVLCTIAVSDFKPNSDQIARIAHSYMNVHEKISDLHLPTDTHWSTRQEQLLKVLSEKYPTFVAALLDALSKTPAKSLEWVGWLALPQERQAAAAVTQQMLTTAPQNWTTSQIKIAGRFSISPDLANRMRTLATQSIASPLNSQNSESSLHNADTATVLEILSKTPTTADYDVMLMATASPERMIRQYGWSGLRKLPIGNPEQELPALGLLYADNRTAAIDGVEANQVVNRLRNVANRLKIPQVPASNASWESWQQFFAATMTTPALKTQWDELNAPPADWLDLVKSSSSLTGDKTRGNALFQRGQCIQCHNSSQAIGPSLSGATKRFSYNDLFQAMYEPNRDISDRFRATKILDTDNQVTVGIVIDENDETITLRLADGMSKTIDIQSIEERQESEVSLMPANLLQGWNAAQLADLYAYLRDLN